MKAIKRPSEYGAGFLGAKSYMIPSPLRKCRSYCTLEFSCWDGVLSHSIDFCSREYCNGKPSEFTPNTSQLIKEAVEKYFDKSEFAIFLGGPEVGEEFSNFPSIIFFIPAVEELPRRCLVKLENIVPTTMELGGKSPTIISDDADFKTCSKKNIIRKNLE